MPSALLAFCSDLESLTSFTVILLLLVYIIMAVAALISRRRRHFHHPYLMPLWPLPVVVALLCCLYVLWTILIASSLKDFIIIAGIIGFGLALNHLRGRQTAPSPPLNRRRITMTQRAQDLGIIIGQGTPGPLNAITDVPGVRVGHASIHADLADGRSVRTGVTVIEPRPGSARHAPALPACTC